MDAWIDSIDKVKSLMMTRSAYVKSGILIHPRPTFEMAELGRFMYHRSYGAVLRIMEQKLRLGLKIQNRILHPQLTTFFHGGGAIRDESPRSGGISKALWDKP